MNNHILTAEDIKVLFGNIAAANDNNILVGHITQQQFADTLGVTIRTLQRMHAARCGPARIKVGRAIYYRVDTVREWLAANENKPTTRQPKRK